MRADARRARARRSRWQLRCPCGSAPRAGFSRIDRAPIAAAWPCPVVHDFCAFLVLFCGPGWGHLQQAEIIKETKMSKRLDYNHIAPAGVKALGGVYGYVTQSNLPATLINLVYLRVSQINNCAYCLDMHTRDLLKSGVSIEKLALVQAWEDG